MSSTNPAPSADPADPAASQGPDRRRVLCGPAAAVAAAPGVLAACSSGNDDSGGGLPLLTPVPTRVVDGNVQLA